jgi:hypothetical protein
VCSLVVPLGAENSLTHARGLRITPTPEAGEGSLAESPSVTERLEVEALPPLRVIVPFGTTVSPLAICAHHGLRRASVAWGSRGPKVKRKNWTPTPNFSTAR